MPIFHLVIFSPSRILKLLEKPVILFFPPWSGKPMEIPDKINSTNWNDREGRRGIGRVGFLLLIR
jgi:hypothetical protein